MERLQKKCFLGSLVTHTILVSVLMAGTAFMGEKTFKPLTEIQEIPINLIDVDALTDGPSRQGGGGGGGSPAPAAPAVQTPLPPPPSQAETRPEPVMPPPPPPVVEPPKVQPMEAVRIEPPKQDTKKKAPKDEPKKAPTKAPEPVKQEPKKVVIKPNLAMVDRSKTTDADAKKKAAAAAANAEKARAEANAKAIRDARNRQTAVNNAIGRAFDNLNEGLSQSGGGLDFPTIGAGSGKGWGIGSGPTLMNYAQYVREIYDLHWIVTDAVQGDAGIVRVEVVVQRNGAARGKIIKPSGNTMLDRSVQAALDKVKNIGKPFPEGATDSSRTFIINFNLTSKRGLG